MWAEVATIGCYKHTKFHGNVLDGFGETASKRLCTQFCDLIPFQYLLHSTCLWSYYSRLEGAMKLAFCHYARLELCYCVASFFAEVKIFIFRPKTMDYSSWFYFRESEKSFEKSMPLYSKRKEKSNGACFSRTAPSSGELLAFHVFYSLYI